ncbi:MAG: hypothetical protein JSS14_11455 [Proteobacteria bacterium]|nr:hypothetical protein [Pseudomonadota bacterium]
MKFRFFLLPYLLAVVAWPVWAQVPSSQSSVAPVSQEDKDAIEKARIGDERKAADVRYEQDRTVCYQKFAVQDCLNDVRRKRRAKVEELNRQEAAINDAERKRRGAAELDRLEQQKGGLSADDAAKREQALQSQRDREQRAADHASERQSKEAQAAANRRDFENKQRAHAQEQADAAERRAQEDAMRQRYEARLKQAEQDRAELEERNAKRTKPRSAPLPTPP